MLKILLSLWLALSLLSPALAQRPKPPPLAESQTGISFPPALGPLKRKGMKKYRSPELGVSYRYAGSPLPIADIYIYDNGLKNLGTGINQAVRLHFAEVQNEIFLMEKSGYYKSVKKVSTGETVLANGSRKLPALSAVFTFSIPPGKGVAYTGVRTSHILLTAYKGQFLKIQFTYPKNQGNQGKKAWQQFLAAFGKALNGKKTLNKPKTKNNRKTSRKPRPKPGIARR